MRNVWRQAKTNTRSRVDTSQYSPAHLCTTIRSLGRRDIGELDGYTSGDFIEHDLECCAYQLAFFRSKNHSVAARRIVKTAGGPVDHLRYPPTWVRRGCQHLADAQTSDSPLRHGTSKLLQFMRLRSTQCSQVGFRG